LSEVATAFAIQVAATVVGGVILMLLQSRLFKKMPIVAQAEKQLSALLLKK
jgi:hypothetical protein